MAYEFFVVMQKRSDGKVYADLHKTDERMYLIEEEADAALAGMGELTKHFHKVKMVGVLADEIERLEKELAIFEDAVEHCTDPNYTKRSTTASDGWTMISSEFYFDLVMAYNDTVRKEYRKRILLEAAEFFGDSEVTAILRGMAEE